MSRFYVLALPDDSDEGFERQVYYDLGEAIVEFIKATEAHEYAELTWSG